jgi:MFS family permease
MLAFVALAVAAASADSSVVALALPQLYGDFKTTIVGVSWVLTSYNAAVAASAVVLLAVRRARSYVTGAILFLLASAACAAAPNLTVLIAARCVQGVGAALLLAGSFSLIGARRWSAAAAVGVAAGPAVGGLLTQAFDWRAIFVLQVPVAALGLVAARMQTTEPEPERPQPPAELAIGLLFGALVGALFLAVLLIVAGWRYSPIHGALVVSVLPLGALVARGRAAPAGAALLALGLVALAILPGASVLWPICALGLCGVGLGFALPALTERALRGGAVLTVAARHAGLVASLALVAPILAHELPSAGRHAELQATSLILDSPVGLTRKVPVALDLGRAFHDAQSGAVPDLRAPFDAHGAGHDRALARTRDRLSSTVDRTIARAFRTSFVVCAAFAAAAALIARRAL